MFQRQKVRPGSMVCVDHIHRKSTEALCNGNCQKKRVYEDMKQNFDTPQFATCESDYST